MGSGSAAAEVAAAITRGDAAWERRAEGHVGALAAPGPIGQAVAAYEEAFEHAPDDLEARWKLMRALFFLGEHVAAGREERLRVFDRGRQLGEAGIDQLAADAGGSGPFFALSAADLRAVVSEPIEAAEVLFWSAVHTGLWGQTRGKLASAREGVAGRIRDYAEASIALDETIQGGGGHRVLGRLHTEAPKIPFITGWVDRKLAVRELERCFAISSDDATTRLYLGEALVKFVPRRRQEGLELLRDLLTRKPNPRWLVEEKKAIRDAEELLARVED